jgi:hypothetical protein
MQQIKIYQTKKLKFRPTYVYELNKKNWFITKIVSWLIKFGVIRDYIDETETVSVIDFDPKDITNAIYEQMKSLYVVDYKPSKVYISAECFYHLCYNKSKEIVNYIDFDVKMGYNGTIFNLPVTAVPHMTQDILVI